MKPKSTHAKGKRMEKFIAREIEKAGLGRATREISSGSGKRKGDIFANIPFLIEAKNQKRIRILKWIDQARQEAEIGNWNPDKWALVFRDPRLGEFKKVYAVIDFWQFLELLKRNQEPLIKEPDREMKWLLQKLKININQILRRLK